jgi:hypothetical protein
MYVDSGCVKRFMGDIGIVFKVNRNNQLVLDSFLKSFPRMKPLKVVEVSSSLKKGYGVIDIETFMGSKGGYHPFAIGVYHENSGVPHFKYFYLTDYSDEKLMFLDCFDYIISKNIKTL